MRERKKTAVHGTLEMTYMAVKFNFQQVLLKTLISKINGLKVMADYSLLSSAWSYPVNTCRLEQVDSGCCIKCKKRIDYQ